MFSWVSRSTSVPQKSDKPHFKPLLASESMRHNLDTSGLACSKWPLVQFRAVSKHSGTGILNFKLLKNFEVSSNI